MNTLSIIILIAIAITILFFSLKYRKDQEEEEEEVEIEIDNAPTAGDRYISVPNAIDYEITKKDLLYGDSDGDEVTHVRFHGEIENLYYDKEYTLKYMYKEVLPIDFKLYLKFGTKNEYKIKYNVQSNNFWSQ